MTATKRSTHARLPLRRFAREWALQYLYQLDVTGVEPSDSLLASFWDQQGEVGTLQLGARECRKCRETAETMIRGVLAHRPELDQHIGRCARNWDFARLALIDRNLLRLAAYEIRHCPDVPPAVAIDEALEICRVFGGGGESTAFLNGILDQIRRDCRPPDDAGAV
jgi:transcription antitermination protein NusB